MNGSTHLSRSGYTTKDAETAECYERVLYGEAMVDVAAEVGISDTALRERIKRWCARNNKTYPTMKAGYSKPWWEVTTPPE